MKIFLMILLTAALLAIVIGNIFIRQSLEIQSLKPIGRMSANNQPADKNAAPVSAALSPLQGSIKKIHRTASTPLQKTQEDKKEKIYEP